MAWQQPERQSLAVSHSCSISRPHGAPPAAHLACCLCCSMNAPIMVEVNDETDPLEVRYDALETDHTDPFGP